MRLDLNLNLSRKKIESESQKLPKSGTLVNPDVKCQQWAHFLLAILKIYIYLDGKKKLF